MTAGYIDIFLDQGTTCVYTLSLYDDKTNSLINIAGYQFFSSIRLSHYSQNATANFTCTISDASNGKIDISMDAGTTANINPGRYVFDIISINTEKEKQKFIEGIIHVSPTVTKF